MCFASSAVGRRKRVPISIKSASLRWCQPRTPCWLFGSTYLPSLSHGNNTLHSNPCFWERIFASIGILSSVRYSSSPATSTMVLPPPGSSLPGRWRISWCFPKRENAEKNSTNERNNFMRIRIEILWVKWFFYWLNQMRLNGQENLNTSGNLSFLQKLVLSSFYSQILVYRLYVQKHTF